MANIQVLCLYTSFLFNVDTTHVSLGKYLFPRLKSASKGRRLCDAADIMKDTTEELKRLSQNGFQECF
jgi:hypothetical protein